MDLDIRHEEGKRYTTQVDGHQAEISYAEEGGVRDFRHTYVPEELRGRGLAGELVRHALDDTLNTGRRFTTSCPYVERFVQRHPEYRKGLAEGAEGEP